MLNGVDNKLNDVVGELPEPVRKIWDRLADGVSDEEAEGLIDQLTDVVNERIDIPFLSEEDEAGMIIRPAVSMIVETLRGNE